MVIPVKEVLDSRNSPLQLLALQLFIFSKVDFNYDYEEENLAKHSKKDLAFS